MPSAGARASDAAARQRFQSQALCRRTSAEASSWTRSCLERVEDGDDGRPEDDDEHRREDQEDEREEDLDRRLLRALLGCRPAGASASRARGCAGSGRSRRRAARPAPSRARTSARRASSSGSASSRAPASSERPSRCSWIVDPELLAERALDPLGRELERRVQADARLDASRRAGRSAPACRSRSGTAARRPLPVHDEVRADPADERPRTRTPRSAIAVLDAGATANQIQKRRQRERAEHLVADEHPRRRPVHARRDQLLAELAPR